MFVPGLPSDKLSKVLFFGGLVMLIVFMTLLFTGNAPLNDYREKAKLQVFDLKSEIIFDSLQNKAMSDTARQTSKQNNFLQIKNNIKIERNKQKINLLNQSLRLQEIDQDNDILYIAYIIIGFITFVIGLIKWSNEEDEETRFYRNKANKEIRNIPCQSCGMQLKYDFRPYMDEEFCSNCFDGTTYTEKELTFSQMSARISNRMKELGIKPKAIQKHIKAVGGLKRWSKEMKW